MFEVSFVDFDVIENFWGEFIVSYRKLWMKTVRFNEVIGGGSDPGWRMLG